MFDRCTPLKIFGFQKSYEASACLPDTEAAAEETSETLEGPGFEAENSEIVFYKVDLGQPQYKNKYAIYAYTHGPVTGSALSPH